MSKQKLLIISIVFLFAACKATQEESSYCVPTSLVGFTHLDNGDSLKILEYSFAYDDQYLVSYSKSFDSTRTGDSFSSNSTVLLDYKDEMLKNRSHSFQNGVKLEYELEWSEEKLNKYSFKRLREGEISGSFDSEEILNDDCGVEFINGRIKNVLEEGERDIKVRYFHSDDCFITTDALTLISNTYSDSSSIFKDLKGINGLIGGSYDNLFSRLDFIPIMNPKNRRIKEMHFFNPKGGKVYTYSYFNFLEETEYPEYFTSNSFQNERPLKESFVVNYSCVNK